MKRMNFFNKKMLIGVPIVLFITVAIILFLNQNNNASALDVTLKEEVKIMANGMNEKDTIKFKMLNSSYFYEAVKGKYEETSVFIDDEQEVDDNLKQWEYEIDYDKGLAHSKLVSLNKENEVTEQKDFFINQYEFDDYSELTNNVSDSVKEENLKKYGSLKTKEKLKNYNYVEREAKVGDVNPEYVEAIGNLDRSKKRNSKRVAQDSLVKSSTLLSDMSNTSSEENIPYLLANSLDVMTGSVTNPQESAVLFLDERNEWDIVETTSYLGRDAYVIKGKVSPEVKNNFDSFELIVDKETGILLFENVFYNENDNVLISKMIKSTEIIIITENQKNVRSRINTADSIIDESVFIQPNSDEYVDKIQIDEIIEKEEKFDRIVQESSEEEKTEILEYFDSNPSEKSDFDLYLEENPDKKILFEEKFK